MKNFQVILCTLFLFSCVHCSNPKNTDIQGFWKVKQISKEGRPEEYLYAEINDSILQYWYEGANYLPPYGYTIEDDHLIIWLHNDPDSRKADVGILKSTDSSGFTLEHESQWLEFETIPLEGFQKATGKPWQGLE